MSRSAEAEFQIEKAERRLLERDARREQFLGCAARAAEVLRREFGATRVWLFGSVRRSWFHDASDLDLAVEGVPSSQLGVAWDRLVELLGVEIDLVGVEDAPPELRRRITESGEVVE